MFKPYSLLAIGLTYLILALGGSAVTYAQTTANQLCQARTSSGKVITLSCERLRALQQKSRANSATQPKSNVPSRPKTLPAAAQSSRQPATAAAGLRPRHYLGIRLGATTLKPVNSDQAAVSGQGTELQYEWRPNNFGIKLGYIDFGQYNFTGSTLQASGLLAGLTFNYPIGAFSFAAEAGLSALNTKETSATATKTNSEPRGYLSIGGDYLITPRLALQGRYNVYAGDLSSISIGLNYAVK